MRRNEILHAGRLGGLEPAALADEFGTPLFVYDLGVIERLAAALRAVLPARFDLAYAVKANPSLGVVAFVASLGLGADVASGGELDLVLAAGFDPGAVVFTGPGKRDDELRAAVRARLRAITVESPGELERVEAIAASAGAVVPILLRLSVARDRRSDRDRSAGDDIAGKFGMDEVDLPAVARRAVASRHLRLVGLHAFGASNVLDAGTLADHVETTVRTARRLAVDAGHRLALIDAGGGFGIPYALDGEPLDLDGLGARLRALDRAMSSDPVTSSTRVLLEPGRFLAGPAGAYLARIVDRKRVDGELVIVLDGGIHHVLRPALVGQAHRVEAFGGGDRDTESVGETVTVAGPLCTGRDVFVRHGRLPVTRVGDLVAVLDVGAYGFTQSMPLFLSHPTPAEVAIRAGRVQLLRRPVEPASWLRDQLLPDWTGVDSRSSAATRSMVPS